MYQEEIFKNLEENIQYQVSNFGRIKSLKKNKSIILKHGTTNNGHYYVNLCINGKIKRMYIHYLVANTFVVNPDKKNKIFVDHIDRNKTNNYASNLRWVTPQENNFNMSLAKNNKSGATGVHYSKKLNKWIAYIKINYKRKHLGVYLNMEDAITARTNAVNTYFIIK